MTEATRDYTNAVNQGNRGQKAKTIDHGDYLRFSHALFLPRLVSLALVVGHGAIRDHNAVVRKAGDLISTQINGQTRQLVVDIINVLIDNDRSRIARGGRLSSPGRTEQTKKKLSCNESSPGIIVVSRMV